MTISTFYAPENYSNAGVGPYQFSFDVINTASVTVKVDDVVVTNYNVELNGTGPIFSGGSVTFTSAPVGSTITIERDTPQNQLTDYQAFDRFPAESHEFALDKLTLLVQETLFSGSGGSGGGDFLPLAGGTMNPNAAINWQATDGSQGSITFTNSLGFPAFTMGPVASAPNDEVGYVFFVSADATKSFQMTQSGIFQIRSDKPSLQFRDNLLGVQGQMNFGEIAGGIASFFWGPAPGEPDMTHIWLIDEAGNKSLAYGNDGALVTQGGPDYASLPGNAYITKQQFIDNGGGGATDFLALTGGTMESGALMEWDSSNGNKGSIQFTNSLGFPAFLFGPSATSATNSVGYVFWLDDSGTESFQFAQNGVFKIRHNQPEFELTNLGLSATAQLVLGDVGGGVPGVVWGPPVGAPNLAQSWIVTPSGSIRLDLGINGGLQITGGPDYATLTGNSYITKDMFIAEGGAGIPDAPADSNTYGRNNNAWVVTGSPASGPFLALAGGTMDDGAGINWTDATNAATAAYTFDDIGGAAAFVFSPGVGGPNIAYSFRISEDGSIALNYGTNGELVLAGRGSYASIVGTAVITKDDLEANKGIPDAPADTQVYGRQNNAWVVVTGGGGSAVWGSITGTLSDQTDLQAELNAKAPTANPDFTGAVDLLNGAKKWSFEASNVLGVNQLTISPTGNSSAIAFRVINSSGVTRDIGIGVNGDLNINGGKVSGLGTPTAGSDATTKTYVDSGLAGKANSGADLTATWGQITGTLSNQTDLQNALDAKAPVSTTMTLNTSQTVTATKTFSAQVFHTADIDMQVNEVKNASAFRVAGTGASGVVELAGVMHLAGTAGKQVSVSADNFGRVWSFRTDGRLRGPSGITPTNGGDYVTLDYLNSVLP